MPSVVSKIKDAMHGGREGPPYDDEYETGRHDNTGTTGYEQDRYAGTSSQDPSHLPGSYPNTDTTGTAGYGEPSSHHADGHKYVAPHGTHVGQNQPGQQGQQSQLGQQGQVGQHGQYGQTGQHGQHDQHGQHSQLGQHGQRGQTGRPGEVTDKDALMDPNSEGTGSNVLGGAAVGTTSVHDSQHTGSNKLHKRDDPRGYESGAYSSAVPSSGQHQGREEDRHLRDNVADPSNRHGHGHGHAGNTLDPRTQSHGLHDERGQQQHTTNTTTTTTSSHFPHGQHDTRQTHPGQNTSNYQQDHQRHNNPAATAAATAAGGVAASQLTDRSRHHDDTSRHGTGVHQQQALDPKHDGRTDQRDHATAGGLGHDGRGGAVGGGGGVYNTVVGRGSNDGELPHSNRGVDDLSSSSRAHGTHTGIGSGIAGAGAGAGLAQSQGVGKHNAIPREAGDSRITSGGGVHDPTSGVGRQGLDPTSSTHPHTTNQGPMARDSTAVGGGFGGAGSNSSGGGGLHSNAKVMHKCTGCGQDNDISHYFKKDLVYRVDHQ